jgi:predicted nucleic acid-binding protein
LGTVTVLVDSDILVEVSRSRDRQILLRWEELSRSEGFVLYSPVTAAELWAGAWPREYEGLTKLLRTLICVPIDADTGRLAGDYLRHYRKSHGLALGDALIAATAFLNRAQLWTRNYKHYPMKELSFF